jgi:OmpA-OmpF porin, OOP family
MSRLTAVIALPLALFAFSAGAQFGDLLDGARRKAEEAAKQKAEEATKKAAPEKQEEAKPPAGREGGKEAPGQPPASDKAAGETAAPPPGEVYGNRYDFVPGDKVLVYDDFSDTDVGEYPAKWTVKDGGGGNAVEVVERSNRRYLKSRFQKGAQQGWSAHFLRYAIKGDLPKNFTIEFDADLAGPISAIFTKFRSYGGRELELPGGGRAVSAHAEGRLPVTTGVHHVAIAVSGTQVKLYVAGERVLADPDGVERPITRLGIHFQTPRAEEGDHQMFTAYRLAEGGKPAKQMLAGEGRIVTHGILFDTGSDVIKPESGPTLRAILQLLQEDAKLRFSIEGHTDDQGGPKVNQPLSERRAAAVKAWLVKQGIDAGRLASKGFGQTKPIDQNASAEGRANNRRVEFVRI